MTHRVLVVDDEDNIRVVLRRILEREGYEVLTAASAEEAVQCVASSLTSVAFCDVHLRGANGLWLADQIRTLSPTTALILATGDPRIPATESLRSGVVSYLLKPFRRERIVAAVKDGIRWSDETIARGAHHRPRRLLDSARS